MGIGPGVDGYCIGLYRRKRLGVVRKKRHATKLFLDLIATLNAAAAQASDFKFLIGFIGPSMTQAHIAETYNKHFDLFHLPSIHVLRTCKSLLKCTRLAR